MVRTSKHLLLDASHMHVLQLNYPLQPTGNASSPVWALDAGFSSTHVEFGSDKGTSGFGFTDGVWGAGAVPEPQGETAKQRAEVWFQAVSRGH